MCHSTSITNLSINAVSLPKHMIVASASNDLLHVIHARSDGSKLDNTTHANGEWVETNNVSPSMQGEMPITPQNQNAHSIVNTVKLPIRCQDQSNMQPQPVKI